MVNRKNVQEPFRPPTGWKFTSNSKPKVGSTPAASSSKPKVGSTPAASSKPPKVIIRVRKIQQPKLDTFLDRPVNPTKETKEALARPSYAVDTNYVLTQDKLDAFNANEKRETEENKTKVERLAAEEETKKKKAEEVKKAVEEAGRLALIASAPKVFTKKLSMAEYTARALAAASGNVAPKRKLDDVDGDKAQQLQPQKKAKITPSAADEELEKVKTNTASAVEKTCDAAQRKDADIPSEKSEDTSSAGSAGAASATVTPGLRDTPETQLSSPQSSSPKPAQKSAEEPKKQNETAEKKAIDASSTNEKTSFTLKEAHSGAEKYIAPQKSATEPQKNDVAKKALTAQQAEDNSVLQAEVHLSYELMTQAEADVFTTALDQHLALSEGTEVEIGQLPDDALAFAIRYVRGELAAEKEARNASDETQKPANEPQKQDETAEKEARNASSPIKSSANEPQKTAEKKTQDASSQTKTLANEPQKQHKAAGTTNGASNSNAGDGQKKRATTNGKQHNAAANQQGSVKPAPNFTPAKDPSEKPKIAEKGPSRLAKQVAGKKRSRRDLDAEEDEAADEPKRLKLVDEVPALAVASEPVLDESAPVAPEPAPSAEKEVSAQPAAPAKQPSQKRKRARDAGGEDAEDQPGPSKKTKTASPVNGKKEVVAEGSTEAAKTKAKKSVSTNEKNSANDGAPKSKKAPAATAAAKNTDAHPRLRGQEGRREVHQPQDAGGSGG